MRKTWISVMIVLSMCLFGCEDTASNTSGNAGNAENNEADANTESQSAAAAWIVSEPINITSIDEMEAGSMWEDSCNGIRFENLGYPSAFTGDFILPDYKTDQCTGNAISAAQGSMYGILDYSGNVLYPFSLPAGSDLGYKSRSVKSRFADMKSPIFSYDYTFWIIADMGSSQFSLDFTSLSEPLGIGGEAIDSYYFILNDELHVNGMRPFSINPKVISAAVDVHDASGNTTGFAIVKDDKILYQFDGNAVIFTNGFVMYEQNGKYGFIDASTGQKITEAVYDDAKYFVEDYAPVKKGGMWAYIDSTGKEVTEFIFEDASTPYEGRVFVKANGAYRILDLKTSVNDLDFVTAASLGELPEPTGPKTIGKVTVNVTDLNIRTGPGTSYDKTGSHAAQGTPYDVYETAEADGYTWYRIGEGQWIADDGTWVTFEE